MKYILALYLISAGFIISSAGQSSTAGQLRLTPDEILAMKASRTCSSGFVKLFSGPGDRVSRRPIQSRTVYDLIESSRQHKNCGA